MDGATCGHPTPQVLCSFGLGKLDDRLAEAVQQHLESCPDCQKQIAKLPADSFLGRVRDAQDNDKVVGSHLINRPGVEERFLREIRSAARLHHTNIVTAYTALRFGESLALAMEYVNGFDLSQLVKAKGPLSVPQACNFAYQAAQGLQHALGHGMVHRDIKPDNLMLTREGKKPTVKVLDFGLAKVTSEGHADSGLTREGQMLGTPLYIAPEQIRDAQSADIRADVYSLGCTLYYLLAVRPPFVGDHVWDVYQAHFSIDANPLNLVRPEVPVELAAIVAKMIAKEPHRRFQTPGDVAQILGPFFRSPIGQSSLSSTTAPDAVPAETPNSKTGAHPAPAMTGVRRLQSIQHEPRPSQTTSKDVSWESLIEIKDDESLIPAVRPKPAGPKPAPVERPARRRPWVWLSVGAGLLVFGLIAARLGGVLMVKTPDGVIVIEGVPVDAEVRIDRGKISVKWPMSGEPLKIMSVPGQQRLPVRKDGLTTFGELAAGI